MRAYVYVVVLAACGTGSSTQPAMADPAPVPKIIADAAVPAPAAVVCPVPETAAPCAVDDTAARTMFEAEFVPWLAAGKTGPDGKFTGYNVTELHASRKKTGKFQTPVYARPKDLLMVDLSKFTKDAHGRRIWGRIDDS